MHSQNNRQKFNYKENRNKINTNRGILQQTNTLRAPYGFSASVRQNNYGCPQNYGPYQQNKGHFQEYRGQFYQNYSQFQRHHGPLHPTYNQLQNSTPRFVERYSNPTFAQLNDSSYNFPRIFCPVLVYPFWQPMNLGLQYDSSNFGRSVVQPFPRIQTAIPIPNMVQNINVQRPLNPQLDGKLLGNQFGLRSWILEKSEAEKLKSTPDGICSKVVNEMSNLKLLHPNEPLHKYFSGPISMSVEPTHFENNVGAQECTFPDTSVTNREFINSQYEDFGFSGHEMKVQLENFNDDLLFFIFYNFTKDKLQVSAAKVLFKKGWRYHIELKIWISRNENAVYTPLSRRDPNYLVERGVYNWFNVVSWEIQQSEMICDFSKLDFTFFLNE